MKILLVHNFYGSTAPSGENQVFMAEKALLQARGHEVLEFTRHSDEIRGQGVMGLVRGAAATPLNPWMMRAIRAKVAEFQPDVVHAHNTFPLISPGIFHAVPVPVARVLTLHNYRLFCAAGIPMREGRPCVECLTQHSVAPALAHACYRGSRIATFPLAAGIALHRSAGTWQHKVDRFIALSDFQRSQMTRAGLPEGKVVVKPNFYPGTPGVVPWESREPYFVFVGRLGAEKGVVTLLKAWQQWGASAPELRLVGDGELRQELEEMARGLPVRFLGQLSAAEAQAQIARARLLVLPSEWFEGFPMVIREAFAFGTPVAVSDIGPLPHIVQHERSGLVFPPAQAEGLLSALQRLQKDQGLLERLGQGARQEFDTHYNEHENYRILMDIYEQAIACRRQAAT